MLGGAERRSTPETLDNWFDTMLSTASLISTLCRSPPESDARRRSSRTECSGDDENVLRLCSADCRRGEPGHLRPSAYASPRRLESRLGSGLVCQPVFGSGAGVVLRVG